MNKTTPFTEYESEVRSYCRSFPIVANKAKGSLIYTEEGNRYIDFFAGAGALNYGHNHDGMKKALIEYLQQDRIIHGLDMYTVAKRDFIEAFQQKILAPKGLNYKQQYCSPTGTNAVEAALKLARKVTGREGIFSFQGGFHGMTLGSLAATGNSYNRNGAGTSLNNVTFMPFPHGFMTSFDTIEYIEHVISDPSSGIEKPAAILLETLQAEGGVNVAPTQWLIHLKALCEKHNILMIVDDIQVGCGRTGDFFSFERAEIQPDIVTLSKSLSGYGLPFAMVLLKPELDQWKPGEHNGTFRGNQLAFVGATMAIDLWQSDSLQLQLAQNIATVDSMFAKLAKHMPDSIEMRGLGLIRGIDCTSLNNPDFVSSVLKECFNNGLIIESAGRKGQVLKLLPALNIPTDIFEEGLNTLMEAISMQLK